MKGGGFFGALVAGVVALALAPALEACTWTTTVSGQTRCTPGNNVFCYCTSGARGTRLCKEDGDSFEACTTGGGACEEDLSHPGAGEPVPDLKDEVDAAGPVDPLEACPGRAVALSPGDDIVIEGDTAGARDDASGTGACGVGVQSPDHVYWLRPTGTGTVAVKVQGDGAFNPTVYVRTACDDPNTQTRCGETTGPGGLEQFNQRVVTGRDYFLFVDGSGGSAGKYTVTMKLTTGAFCGDGNVDPNEACDDGNNLDGDGCSASCQNVSGDPSSGNSCPGHPVHVWPGRTVIGEGSTNPYGNTFKRVGSSCSVLTSDLNVAQDHVYAVTAHGDGTLRVLLTPAATFNSMLIARTACEDGASTGGGMCANQAAGVPEEITIPVTKDQTVYVAADGVLAAKGTYQISFRLQ